MTESFSACEAFFSGSAGFFSGLAEQAAAQGITFLVASGDGGPDSCDDPSVPPASTPRRSTSWPPPGTPWPSAARCSMTRQMPAPIGILARANGGTPQNPTFPKMSGTKAAPSAMWRYFGWPLVQRRRAEHDLRRSRLGKPASTAFPPPTRASFPTWRLTAADHDGYIVCLDASCSGSSQSFFIFSGTSASVQSFGGIMALVVQKVGRVGIANITLYNLAHTQQTAGTSCNGSSTFRPPRRPPRAFLTI